jgi:ferric-dicitrate binding protein FerR (iron transport regulator)
MIPPDIQPQIQRMLDGELSEGELSALEAELMDNGESRKVYQQLASLHSDLEVFYTGQSALGKSNVVPIELVVAKQRKRVFKIALYAAAAMIMISMALLHLTKVPDQALASFRTTPSADFSLTHNLDADDAPEGQVLVVGSKLNLQKGILESEFKSGVRVVLEAPCVLRVLADDRVAIDEGVAWFEVPKNAVGFTVETTKLKVVDLGTAFGVACSLETGHDEVHVTRGAVEVTARIGDGKSETLIEGEARRVNKLGELEEIKIDADRFTDALPTSQGLIGHWRFEDAIDGVYTSDSSGNGHTGRLEGGAEVITDPVRGKVLSLSGIPSSKDMVDIDSVKNISNLLANRGITLAAWVKLNSVSSTNLQYAYVVGLGQEGDHPIATLGVLNGVVNGYLEGDVASRQVGVTGDTTIKAGVWTHIAITIDRVGNKAISYVNGVAQASPVDISAIDDGELDWGFGTIGRTLGSNHIQYFGGLIDDVRIYDRPLSSKEVAELVK